MQKLEQDPDCKIYDDGWKSSGYGNPIENGIMVSFRTMKFKIICSHEDLLVYRISGNKSRFYRFCESIKEIDFDW